MDQGTVIWDNPEEAVAVAACLVALRNCFIDIATEGYTDCTITTVVEIIEQAGKTQGLSQYIEAIDEQIDELERARN